MITVVGFGVSHSEINSVKICSIYILYLHHTNTKILLPKNNLKHFTYDTKLLLMQHCEYVV